MSDPVENAISAEHSRQEQAFDERKALEDCVGALQFILAFYEPGQSYLDTEAWKSACARGVDAYQRGAAIIGWHQTWKRGCTPGTVERQFADKAGES